MARQVVGLELEDPDKAVSALEHAIRDLTKPAVEAHTVPVKLGNGRHVLVVEMPRSLNAPHMADGRFYRRVGRSTVPMNYMDIRRAFAELGDAVRKLRERLHRWIEDMERGHGPVEWKPQPALFLYVASVPAFDGELARVFGPDDLQRVNRLSMYATGTDRPQFCAEGLVVSGSLRKKCHSFVLLTPEGELLHGLGPLDGCPDQASEELPRIRVAEIQSEVITTLGLIPPDHGTGLLRPVLRRPGLRPGNGVPAPR